MNHFRYSITNLLLILISFLCLGFDKPGVKQVMPPGLYSFSYMSNLGLIGTATPQNWENPKAFDRPKGVRFEVVNDSLIYKHSYDINGKKIPGTTSIAKRTSSKVLAKFKPVPKNYLDYELVGIYNYDHLPTDIWQAFYYSKKRKSLMSVGHSFELNRIDHVIIFMDQPEHPFKDYKKFFKVLEGDAASYNYPVIKRKSIVGSKN